MIGRLLPLALAMALVLSGCDLESTSSATRQGTSLTLNAFARTAAALPSASRVEIVFSSDSGTRSIDTVHSKGTALALGRVGYGKRFSLSVIGYDTSSKQKVVRWYGSATDSANGYDVQQVDVALDSVVYGATLTDSRDAQTYRTAKIGARTWMAENLNCKHKAAGSTDTVGRCYGDSAVSCTRYGRLYTWAEAMGLDASFNRKASGKAPTSGVQGLCPAGWHVPDSTEWTALFQAVGGADSAGYRLKANSVLWKRGSGLLDAWGFSSLPGGDALDRAGKTIHELAGELAAYPSATESVDSARCFSVSGDSPIVTSFEGSKFLNLSLRCVKD
jgi:uncharacterized protein (TIGR02145 family)